MVYRIPTSLKNLDKILLDNNIDKKLVKNHLMKFYYIIHKLKQETIYNKKIKQNGCYISLNSDIIESLLGKRYYKPVMNALIQLDIVQYDSLRKYSNSITNSYSKRYRLNSKYLLGCTHFNLNDTETRFSKKIDNFRLQKLNLLRLKNREYNAQFLSLRELRLDFDKVNTLFNSFGYDNLFNSSNTKEEINEILLNLVGIDDTVDSIIYSICDINLFNYNNLDGLRFTVDNKGFRVHDNLTNLNKKLRLCCYYNGRQEEGIAECDLVASQLSFLTVNMAQSGCNELEYANFMNDINTTDIYTILSDKDNRTDCKTDVFTNILFGKLNNSKVNRNFKKKYPEVYSYLEFMKKDNYKNSSILLQKTESSFMTRLIVNKILDIYPDLLFNTIHDSIFVEAGYEMVIGKLIKDTMKDLYNIKVSLKITNYTDGTEEKI